MRLRPLSKTAGSLAIDTPLDSESGHPIGKPNFSRFMRIDLVAGELDISTSTIYSHIAQRIFPPPVKIGTASVWLRTEIDAYQSAVIGGASRAELEKLVTSLIASRRGGALAKQNRIASE